MKKIAVLFCLFYCVSASSQNYKTLKDSVFKKGDVIRCPEILFSSWRICCFSTHGDSIKQLGKFLEQHSELKVEIGIHSDSRGALAGNEKITYYRAKSFREYLNINFKIDTSHISYKGYGESKPIISEAQIKKAKTEEEKNTLHSMNRRIELIVTGFVSQEPLQSGSGLKE